MLTWVDCVQKQPAQQLKCSVCDKPASAEDHAANHGALCGCGDLPPTKDSPHDIWASCVVRAAASSTCGDVSALLKHCDVCHPPCFARWLFSIMAFAKCHRLLLSCLLDSTVTAHGGGMATSKRKRSASRIVTAVFQLRTWCKVCIRRSCLCRDCELLRVRTKAAGHTWTDAKTAIAKGQLAVSPVPTFEVVKAALDTMLLGRPAARQDSNGRAERAAQRERQST